MALKYSVFYAIKNFNKREDANKNISRSAEKMTEFAFKKPPRSAVLKEVPKVNRLDKD